MFEFQVTDTSSFIGSGFPLPKLFHFHEMRCIKFSSLFLAGLCMFHLFPFTFAFSNRIFRLRSTFTPWFTDINFEPKVQQGLRNMNAAIPTPIQLAAIPSIIKGKSCVVHSETGSGKTLAYLLPMFFKLLKHHSEFGATDKSDPFGPITKSLILVPTKELAIQVCKLLISSSSSVIFQ